jgi:phosphate-selective porin OprO/OprP
MRLAPAAIIAAASFHTVFFVEARAQSAASNDAEIAALKQQLRLIEKKLDALQKPTAAKTKAPAQSIEKVDSWVETTSANATIPATAPSGVVVTMPANRPTICTADNLNCVSITSRLHFDVGAYDYRPNTAATNPQSLDDGINAAGRAWG